MVRKCSGLGRGESVGKVISLLGLHRRACHVPGRVFAGRIPRRHRQGDAKNRSHAWLTFTRNGTAMGDYNFAGNGQAQSRAASPAVSGDAEESVEYTRQILGRNTHSGV